MPRRLMALSMAGCLAMMTSSCGAAEEVATLQHDFGGGGTLRAFAAEPGARTGAAKTPYLCVWRDTGPGRFRATDGPPVEVFLTCVFGTDAWRTPSNYMQEAEARSRREEAVLRANWRRNGSAWRLTRMELEITRPDSTGRFRSVHFDGEVAAVTLRESEITFPATGADPLRFRIVASLPARQNLGRPTMAPTVALTLSGTAEPMPDWLGY